MIPGAEQAFARPISAERPGGEDLACAPELDAIRAARTGDDPSLAQGDWVRDLRTPQWPRVAELCAAILGTRSKDLQVAAWYAEAMARLHGFPGLAAGLRTVELLLGRFWDCCHPAGDGGTGEDPGWDERAGKVEWLNVHLAAAVNLIPDAPPAEGAGEALAACRALELTVARRFAQDPPSLANLAALLQARQERPGRDPSGAAGPPGPRPPEPEPEPAPAWADPPPALDAPVRVPARTRPAAVRELRAIAAFFRATEPHSPVGPLVERAAGWADMPLGRWLAAVIKDPGTLHQLNELLDLDPRDAAPPEIP